MKPNVLLRFYEELNDFFDKDKRKQEFHVPINEGVCIKDLMETLGVPHTEIDLILVNGNSAPFSHVLKDGDRISVYPVFEAFDISNVTRLRPKPLRSLKFILDNDLGGLAKYLRSYGFDISYQDDTKPQGIIHRSLTEKRVILTRNKALLLGKNVIRGYLVRNIAPEKQLQEVIEYFDLTSMIDSL